MQTEAPAKALKNSSGVKGAGDGMNGRVGEARRTTHSRGSMDDGRQAESKPPNLTESAKPLPKGKENEDYDWASGVYLGPSRTFDDHELDYLNQEFQEPVAEVKQVYRAPSPESIDSFSGIYIGPDEKKKRTTSKEDSKDGAVEDGLEEIEPAQPQHNPIKEAAENEVVEAEDPPPSVSVEEAVVASEDEGPEARALVDKDKPAPMMSSDSGTEEATDSDTADGAGAKKKRDKRKFFLYSYCPKSTNTTQKNIDKSKNLCFKMFKRSFNISDTE